RSYKPGKLEPLGESFVAPQMEPTPVIPFVRRDIAIGQQLLGVILRRHLEKFSCFVEMSTELRLFEQSNEGVTAVLGRNSILV
ncbi:hypothetical protein BDR03DRAFT_880176, partial [Suillus americanus]